MDNVEAFRFMRNQIPDELTDHSDNICQQRCNQLIEIAVTTTYVLKTIN